MIYRLCGRKIIDPFATGPIFDPDQNLVQGDTKPPQSDTKSPNSETIALDEIPGISADSSTHPEKMVE